MISQRSVSLSFLLYPLSSYNNSSTLLKRFSITHKESKLRRNYSKSPSDSSKAALSNIESLSLSLSKKILAKKEKEEEKREEKEREEEARRGASSKWSGAKQDLSFLTLRNSTRYVRASLRGTTRGERWSDRLSQSRRD